MAESLISWSVTLAVALPAAGLLIALLLPRLTKEYKASPHLYWGASAYRAGRYDAALRQYDRAVAIDPSNPAAYQARGFVRWQLGDIAKAVDDFDMAVRLAPDDAVLRCNRGLVRGESGDAALGRGRHPRPRRLSQRRIVFVRMGSLARRVGGGRLAARPSLRGERRRLPVAGPS